LTHSHSFIVTKDVCTQCHGDDFHEDEDSEAGLGPESAQAGGTSSGSTSWLQPAMISSLGLGIGIGGMFGILFVLVSGHIEHRQRRSTR
jgi:uncharacterized membrane protein